MKLSWHGDIYDIHKLAPPAFIWGHVAFQILEKALHLHIAVVFVGT